LFSMGITHLQPEKHPPDKKLYSFMSIYPQARHRPPAREAKTGKDHSRPPRLLAKTVNS